MTTPSPRECFLAAVLVAVMRRHACEAFSFLDEAFGDDAYDLLTALSTIATGDPDEDKAWWNMRFETLYLGKTAH